MPVYDYRCNTCGKTYDVFHKVREVVDDIVCPSCGSPKHTRLLSASTFSMGVKERDSGCSNGNCCGGSCGMN